jgi:predicted enzyme related to lactoylglutathione lyase
MRSIVLDAPDTQRLAEFYCELLGWEITYAETPEEGGWIKISGAGASNLAFQLAPDYQPPKWPDPASAQQIHLDLTVDDLDEAEAQAVKLGATREDHQPSEDGDFRVFRDPAGHLFCFCVD